MGEIMRNRINFKRLGSPRGSILFIVVVIMSVLIAMATVLLIAVRSEKTATRAEVAGQNTYNAVVTASDLIGEYFTQAVSESIFPDGTSPGSGAVYSLAGALFSLPSDGSLLTTEMTLPMFNGAQTKVTISIECVSKSYNDAGDKIMGDQFKVTTKGEGAGSTEEIVRYIAVQRDFVKDEDKKESTFYISGANNLLDRNVMSAAARDWLSTRPRAFFVSPNVDYLNYQMNPDGTDKVYTEADRLADGSFPYGKHLGDRVPTEIDGMSMEGVIYITPNNGAQDYNNNNNLSGGVNGSTTNAHATAAKVYKNNTTGEIIYSPPVLAANIPAGFTLQWAQPQWQKSGNGQGYRQIPSFIYGVKQTTENEQGPFWEYLGTFSQAATRPNNDYHGPYYDIFPANKDYVSWYYDWIDGFTGTLTSNVTFTTDNANPPVNRVANKIREWTKVGIDNWQRIWQRNALEGMSNNIVYGYDYTQNKPTRLILMHSDGTNPAEPITGGTFVSYLPHSGALTDNLSNGLTLAENLDSPKDTTTNAAELIAMGGTTVTDGLVRVEFRGAGTYGAYGYVTGIREYELSYATPTPPDNQIRNQRGSWNVGTTIFTEVVDGRWNENHTGFEAGAYNTEVFYAASAAGGSYVQTNWGSDWSGTWTRYPAGTYFMKEGVGNVDYIINGVWDNNQLVPHGGTQRAPGEINATTNYGTTFGQGLFEYYDGKPPAAEPEWELYPGPNSYYNEIEESSVVLRQKAVEAICDVAGVDPAGLLGTYMPGNNFRLAGSYPYANITAAFTAFSGTGVYGGTNYVSKDSDTTLSGNTYGYLTGIFVQGNLTLSGSFPNLGYVYCGGTLTINSGTTGALIGHMTSLDDRTVHTYIQAGDFIAVANNEFSIPSIKTYSDGAGDWHEYVPEQIVFDDLYDALKPINLNFTGNGVIELVNCDIIGQTLDMRRTGGTVTTDQSQLYGGTDTTMATSTGADANNNIGIVRNPNNMNLTSNSRFFITGSGNRTSPNGSVNFVKNAGVTADPSVPVVDGWAEIIAGDGEVIKYKPLTVVTGSDYYGVILSADGKTILNVNNINVDNAVGFGSFGNGITINTNAQIIWTRRNGGLKEETTGNAPVYLNFIAPTAAGRTPAEASEQWEGAGQFYAMGSINIGKFYKDVFRTVEGVRVFNDKNVSLGYDVEGFAGQLHGLFYTYSNADICGFFDLADDMRASSYSYLFIRNLTDNNLLNLTVYDPTDIEQAGTVYIPDATPPTNIKERAIDPNTGKKDTADFQLKFARVFKGAGRGLTVQSYFTPRVTSLGTDTPLS